MTNTITAYDDFSSTFAQDSLKWTPNDLIDEFSSLLKPDSSVLDVGCGGGRDAQEFSKKGFKVVGLDASKKLIDYDKLSLYCFILLSILEINKVRKLLSFITALLKLISPPL